MKKRLILRSMVMKFSALRKLVRQLVREGEGWPTESTSELYGGGSGVDVRNPRNPKPNTQGATRLPKGPNSRDNLGEGYKRPSQAELQQWSQGNYDEINEDASAMTQDPCEGCGEMKPSNELAQAKDDGSERGGKYLCQACSDKMLRIAEVREKVSGQIATLVLLGAIPSLCSSYE